MENFLIKAFSMAFLFLLSSNAAALKFSIPQHEFDDQFKWSNFDLAMPRIYAEGLIEPGDAERLSEIVSRAGIHSGIVLFNSPGGSLKDGLLLGETIRRLGLSTGIAEFRNGLMVKSGICASACSYAFAGGYHRYFEAGEQSLGIHQFYAAPGSAEISSGETQEISGLLVSYLNSMGINPVAFSVSSSAGPDGMFWLTTEQAELLRLVTNGRGAAIARLKQNSGTTYLSVEQENVDALGRFLFFCLSNQITLAGGYVTNPEDTASKFDWLTWSALIIGKTQLYSLRKNDVANSVIHSDSMISVFRQLTRDDVADILKSKSIGMIFGSDGMVAYGASANLDSVINSVDSFISNCYEL